jgi:hypothetical protein
MLKPTLREITMSEHSEKSLQPVRALSASEVEAVAGAQMAINIPYLGFFVYAGEHGYGASTTSGNYTYAVDVKT